MELVFSEWKLTPETLFQGLDHGSYDAHRSKENMDIVDDGFHARAFPVWWEHHLEVLCKDFEGIGISMESLYDVMYDLVRRRDITLKYKAPTPGQSVTVHMTGTVQSGIAV